MDIDSKREARQRSSMQPQPYRRWLSQLIFMRTTLVLVTALGGFLIFKKNFVKYIRTDCT